MQRILCIKEWSTPVGTSNMEKYTCDVKSRNKIYISTKRVLWDLMISNIDSIWEEFR